MVGVGSVSEGPHGREGQGNIMCCKVVGAVQKEEKDVVRSGPAVERTTHARAGEDVRTSFARTAEGASLWRVLEPDEAMKQGARARR